MSLAPTIETDEFLILGGDHDRFAHILRKGGMGVMSEALCGKRWVPIGRQFGRNVPYPECPTCDELLGELR